MQTVLTTEERDALIERLARWAVKLDIGGRVAFLLEVNRPIAPLTGNACIAMGSFIQGWAPLSVPALGLLLQDDQAVVRLRERIVQLQRGASAEAPGPGGTLVARKT